MRWKFTDPRSRFALTKIVVRADATDAARDQLFAAQLTDPMGSHAGYEAAEVAEAFGARLVCRTCAWSGRYDTRGLMRWIEHQRSAGVSGCSLPDPRDLRSGAVRRARAAHTEG